MIPKNEVIEDKAIIEKLSSEYDLGGLFLSLCDKFVISRFNRTIARLKRAGLLETLTGRDIAGQKIATVRLTKSGLQFQEMLKKHAIAEEEKAEERPDECLDAAVQWLQTALQQGGPKPVKWLADRAKYEVFISRPSLWRAKDQLNVRETCVGGTMS